MKHTLTKVLSLLMALTMIMGSLVLTASAAGEHTHEKGDVVKVVAPTCTTLGYTFYECTADNCTEANNIFAADVTAKIDHNFIDVEATDPTCQEYGYNAHTECEYCGIMPEGENKDDYRIEKIDCIYELYVDEPNPHGGRIWTIGTYATPDYKEGNGRIYEKCTMCGEEIILDVFNGDEHTFVYEITTEPTCVTNGFATYSCADCNQKWENVYVAPNTVDGHSFTKDLHLESECDKDQVVDVKLCAYCDKPEKAIPAIKEHNWTFLTANDTWCNQNGVNWNKVKDCETDGYIVRKCIDCDKHEKFTPASDYADQELYTLYGTHIGHIMTGEVMHGATALEPCSYVKCANCTKMIIIEQDHTWATDTTANRTANLFVDEPIDGEAWTVGTRPATCTIQGIAAVRCTVCKSETAFQLIPTPALGHDGGAGAVYTCTTDNCPGKRDANTGAAAGECVDCTHANRKYDCARCDIIVDVPTQSAHVGTGNEKTIVSTCQTKGYKYKDCAGANCTVHVKTVAELPIDPNHHENFTITRGSFEAKGVCGNEDAVVTWQCVCGVIEVDFNLAIQENYDLVKKNFTAADDATKVYILTELGVANPTSTTAFPAIATFDSPAHDMKVKYDIPSGGAAAGKKTTAFNHTAVAATCLKTGTAEYTECTNLGCTHMEFNGAAINPSVAADAAKLLVPRNTTNHVGIVAGIVYVGYVPATCTTPETIKYYCPCGSEADLKKDVTVTTTIENSLEYRNWTLVTKTGSADTSANGHYKYTFPDNFLIEFTSYTSPTTNVARVETGNGVQLAVIKGNVTADYSCQSFTAYKAANCFQAGNHAYMSCSKCSTNYNVSAGAHTTVVNTNGKLTWNQIPSWDQDPSYYCPVLNCSCKRVNDPTKTGNDVQNTAVTLADGNAAIKIEIPAIDHYKHADKVNNIPNPNLREIAAVTAYCFADGANKYKVCTLCAGMENFDNESYDASTATAEQKNNKALYDLRVAYTAKLAADNKIVAHGDSAWVITKPLAATCTQKGVKASKYCPTCKTYYAPTTTLAALQTAYAADNATVNSVLATLGFQDGTHEIPKLGHDYGAAVNYIQVNGKWIATTEDFPVVCTTAHFTAQRCERFGCDGLLTWADYDADDHVDLADGEYGWYINNFVAVKGHVFAENDLDEDFNYAAHTAIGQVGDSNVYFKNNCTDGKYFYTLCQVEGCGAEHVVLSIREAGCHDANGNLIVVNCSSAAATCVDCNENYAAKSGDHSTHDVKVDATCYADGIIYIACEFCKTEWAKDDDDDLANCTVLKDAEGKLVVDVDVYDALTKLPKLDHAVLTYVNWVKSVPGARGYKEYICRNCGDVIKEDLPAYNNTNVAVEILPYNPVLGTTDPALGVANNGMIKVTLKLSEGTIYSAFDVEIPFDGSLLELVDYEFVYDFDAKLGMENKVTVLDVSSPTSPFADRKKVKIVSYAGVAKENVVIEGVETPFVDLYFNVVAEQYEVDANTGIYYGIDINDEGAYIDFGHDTVSLKAWVSNAAGDALVLETINNLDYDFNFSPIDVHWAFDIDNNEIFDNGDIIALIGMIYNEEGYAPQADLNADGAVDVLDLELLDNFLMTNRTLGDYLEALLGIDLDEVIANADISQYDYDEDGKFGTEGDRLVFGQAVKYLLGDDGADGYSSASAATLERLPAIIHYFLMI